MILRLRLRSFLLLPLLCGSLISAQEIKQPVESGTIQLDVVVTPKSGAPVAGLQEKDFTILDNKVERPIISFHAHDGSQEPIRVILLIDSVNTNFTTIAYERTQLDKFLHADGGHLSHPTTLAILTDKGVQIQPGFTTDGNATASSSAKKPKTELTPEEFERQLEESQLQLLVEKHGAKARRDA